MTALEEVSKIITAAKDERVRGKGISLIAIKKYTTLEPRFVNKALARGIEIGEFKKNGGYYDLAAKPKAKAAAKPKSKAKTVVKAKAGKAKAPKKATKPKAKKATKPKAKKATKPKAKKATKSKAKAKK